MKQAVISSGGKQQIVKEGDVIDVELVGDTKNLTLPAIMVSDGEKALPAGQGQVKATVIDQTKGDKIIVFKMKSKKGYRRKAGHRQKFSRLKIDKITT